VPLGSQLEPTGTTAPIGVWLAEAKVLVAEVREAAVASRVMMLYCISIIVGKMYEEIEQLNECDLS
jgi:hypothetical protein